MIRQLGKFYFLDKQQARTFWQAFEMLAKPINCAADFQARSLFRIMLCGCSGV